LNSVLHGLTGDNLVPTACWFIGAFTVLVDAAATTLQRPFFWQRDGAFTTSLCYAKITPAALHCGKFNARTGEDAEAAGPRAEFELSDSPHVTAGSAPLILRGRRRFEVKQGVPDV
jgi:hypothetical protein